LNGGYGIVWDRGVGIYFRYGTFFYFGPVQKIGKLVNKESLKILLRLYIINKPDYFIPAWIRISMQKSSGSGFRYRIHWHEVMDQTFFSPARVTGIKEENGIWASRNIQAWVPVRYVVCVR
jgi:hypothetical protein